MEEKVHYLQVDTPDGIVKLKISRFILGNDDDVEKVVVSTFIQEKKLSFQAETTETATRRRATKIDANFFIVFYHLFEKIE